jgi:hypothetical protein
MVLGRKSIRSGDPGHSGNQLMAGRASESLSTKHRKIAVLVSEETISNTSWSVWHVEGTVAGADGKPCQLVGGIGLAAQKAGCLPLSGIKELESGVVGNSGPG